MSSCETLERRKDGSRRMSAGQALLMSRELDGGASDYLDRKLGPEHPNRRFAEAVIRHLGSSGSGFTPITAADAVVAVLAGRYNTDEEGLAHDPSLVASLFQNADLLDRSDPGSAAVTRAVMAALERMHREPG